MDESEKLNAVQEILTQAYIEFASKRPERKVKDVQFAKHLGVSNASLNQWLNGLRLPGYENCVQLASKLDIDKANRLFMVLGYKPIEFVSDKDVQFIARNWRMLDDETKTQIITHIRETLQEQGGGATK